jgi:hypothetical protein
MVAELDFSVSFPLEAPSRQIAVALVPSPDMTILSPLDIVPTGERSTGALRAGWAMATDEKPKARRDTRSATRRVMSEPSESDE